uniref:Uncharacterized protein n=1 Tax=Labrus bergylta TaxID=56723 RepID=A0A3Q3KWR7_9LABR
MATLDRQIPSVDTFLCEPWSSFVSATKLRFVDSNQFSALEDFCLVVCHVCNQVVTPQGILTHYGKTHTNANKISREQSIPSFIQIIERKHFVFC